MATYSETPASIQNGTLSATGTLYTVTSGFYAVVSIYLEQSTGNANLGMSGTDFITTAVDISEHEMLLDEGDTLDYTQGGVGSIRFRSREYGRP